MRLRDERIGAISNSRLCSALEKEAYSSSVVRTLGKSHTSERKSQRQKDNLLLQLRRGPATGNTTYVNQLSDESKRDVEISQGSLNAVLGHTRVRCDMSMHRYTQMPLSEVNFLKDCRTTLIFSVISLTGVATLYLRD